MSAIVAALPIIVTLFLLIIGLPAWVAPATGVATAVLLAVLWFDAPWNDLAASWNGNYRTLLHIVAIIGGGVLLSRVMDRTGAQRRLAEWLSTGGPSVPSGLLMANGVVPFMESVIGFGMAVLVGLPLLLSLGFTPYRSSMLALVGLMVSPWGSMGPGTLIAADISGTSLTQMGLMSGWYNLVPFLISGVAAAIIAGGGSHQQRIETADTSSTEISRRTAGPDRGTMASWAGVGLLSGVVLWALVMTANLLFGTPVAGAVAALAMSVMWLSIVRRGRLRPGPDRVLWPYSILLVGAAFGQLLTRAEGLGAFGEVLASPATWSTVAALSGLWILRIEIPQLKKLPREAGLMWCQVAIPTALYVLLGVTIAGGGLAEIIALSFERLGPVYLFLMPFLAGLSGFITAAGTGANAMFGSTQVAAANALNVSPHWVMAMQNSAAGWAIIASPARIELSFRLAAAYQRHDTPGQVISRRALLKGTLPLVLLALLVFGVFNLVFLPKM